MKLFELHWLTTETLTLVFGKSFWEAFTSHGFVEGDYNAIDFYRELGDV
jgi:hypothetical protein